MDEVPVLPPVVCEILTSLLGRCVTSRQIPPYPFALLMRRIVAAYETDDHAVVAVCVCDLALVFYAGAALAMIPAAIARESLAFGRCEDFLLENFLEILSVCRQWFREDERHIVPPRLYTKKKEIPPHVAAVLFAPKSRVDAEIAIPGYGCGQLSIVS